MFGEMVRKDPKKELLIENIDRYFKMAVEYREKNFSYEGYAMGYDIKLKLARMFQAEEHYMESKGEK